ncbi:MAG: ParA family protein [Chloroflexaceae bacterium]|nr:ParA family protein [Chloroflexaceae bacterium]
MNRVLERGRLDLLCSHLSLVGIDMTLAARLYKVEPIHYMKSYLRIYSMLRQGLSRLGPAAYSFILIDCPPNFYMVTRNAIIASDHLLVPTRPDYVSTLGIDELRKHVASLVSDYNNRVNKANDHHWQPIQAKDLRVLFTMVTLHSGSPIRSHESAMQEVKNRGVPTLETLIRDNKSAYADAPGSGIPLVVQPNLSSTSHRDAQQELKHMVDEVLESLP